jgi:hypothetical protein
MTDRKQERKGISLAKGPVGLIGLLLLAYGITALIFGSHGFTEHIPNGTVHGKTWLGLEVNGWSSLLFIAAGLLLLFGAPLHWGAKTMSLIVGIVLGGAALVAVANNGRGVFGLLAANHLTELVWAGAGVLLILLSLLPRVGAKTEPADDRRGARRVEHEPAGVQREPAPRPQRVTSSHVEAENGSPSGATGARVGAGSRAEGG